VHGVLAGTLLVATAWKIRRSVPGAAARGRRGRLALGLLLSLLTVAALTGGFLWVASGRLLSVGSWTVLTIHAWVGLVLVPVVLVHLLPHRWRLLRPRPSAAVRRPTVSRRSLLVAGVLAVAGVGAYAVSVAADRWQGGVRRFTGSRWLPDGGIPPATTFFGEGPPAIDPTTWRLTVSTADAPDTTWSLADLRSIPQVDRTEVLDCTSGWALRTDWQGVPLATLLGAVPAGANVHVRSATGWSTVLDADEVGGAMLALGVAGRPLPLENGAPCRLVVRDRRGLDWVKWVVEVRVA
jgi:DMSO/TMAO reductase YedYZ molybdopterin-dependent catalytic subunit